jgi:hypothetical protein
MMAVVSAGRTSRRCNSYCEQEAVEERLDESHVRPTEEERLRKNRTQILAYRRIQVGTESPLISPSPAGGTA